MRQVYGRPVTLAVAPVPATIPGPPGQLALQLGGFHVRAYHGEAAFPPPEAWTHPLWCCGRGRGLPGPWLPWYCPGGFGRGKPLPYNGSPGVWPIQGPAFFIFHSSLFI